MPAIQTPTRGVPITLDRPRTLRFTLGAVRRILEEKGVAYFEASVGAPTAAENIERLGYLAYQGLRHEDAELTREAVEEMVDFDRIEELSNAVARALGQDLPSTAPAGGGADGDASPTAPAPRRQPKA